MNRPRVFDRISGVDGGECDAPFKITWAGEVDRFKARVNVIAESTDIGVRSCATLPQDERRAWDLFITEWRDFMKKPTPTFGSYGYWVQTCTHAATIDAWRPKLERWCSLPGPREIEKSASIDVLKWGTVALIAVSGVVVLGMLVPEIRSALSGLRKARR